MRRGLLVALTAAVCVGVVAPAGPSGAAKVHSGGHVHLWPQKQWGYAAGEASFSVTGLQPGLFGQADSGTYALHGQLGHGHYRFDAKFPPESSDCVTATDTLRASGSARIVRSDGAVMTGTVSVTERCGGADPSPVAFIVDLTEGTRDLLGSTAHLEFRGVLGDFRTAGPEASRASELLAVVGRVSVPIRVGYWMLDSRGTVHAFGGASWLGNAPTSSAVHIEATQFGNGYWIVDALGQVFAFGNARSYGSVDRAFLAPGEMVTSISASATGLGYWVFTDRGRAQPFGDAKDLGDLHSLVLNDQVIASAVTGTGNGYYMAALDGGVFTFGDARFRGSMGGSHLNLPVIGLVPTIDNRGYWLVAADGGVFAFHAPFLGSMGGVQLREPIIGMARYGRGYVMVAQDGGIFKFSNRPFFGSLGGSPRSFPIVSVAALG